MQGRVIGYVRVGKKDDDSHGFLAGRQIDVIAEWAAENEADVLNWYFDLGVDASEPIDRRPAGSGLLARVKRGDVTDVVVGSLDVLGKGRALLDAVQQLVEVRKGLRVITVLPGPHETAESWEAAETEPDRSDGPRILKAA